MKLILLVFLLLVSCVEVKTLRMTDDVSSSFQKGLDFMRDKNYQVASNYWAKFLKTYPVTNLSPSAYYLWGRSLEKLNKCDEANARYKSAYTLWGSTPSKDKARTKLRIASCHLRLGESDKAIAELNELNRMRNLMSWEDYNIERNSLLAIAYAKESNAQESERYYQQVEKFIQQALGSNKNLDSEWLSDLYFRLAINLSTVSNGQVQKAVIEMKQRYLARIIEKEDKILSTSARQELIRMYEEAYDYLDKRKISGALDEQNTEYTKTRDEMQGMQSAVLTLDLEFSPVYEEGANTKDLEKWLLGFKTKVQNWINRPLPNQSISPEAQERQSIKQKGKLVPLKKDPNL